MEASALTAAGHSGLLARRSPLLRLQNDEKLVALIRDGHDRAFEVLFDRYSARLLSFCRHMVSSSQDAEDLLQDVFVAAHSAMLADERPITARPWLYRIARNRCLNFLRKPVADGQDSMDVHPYANGATTFERVQRREELRTIVADVQDLPETQRTALVLREIDGLTYTEIAQTMGVSLPAVKSLLVRARMALAEASEARVLACDDVRLELAEAAEGVGKVSGAARRHVKDCPSCKRFRNQLRSTSRSLAGLAPLGLFAFVGKFFASKLAGTGGGSAASASGTAGSAGATGGAAGGGAGAAGAGAAGSVGAVGSVGGVAGSVGGAAAAAGGTGVSVGGALGTVGGVVGAKAAVGVATAVLITAGAVGANHMSQTPAPPHPAAVAQTAQWSVEHGRADTAATVVPTAPPVAETTTTEAVAPPATDPTSTTDTTATTDTAPPTDTTSTDTTTGADTGTATDTTGSGTDTTTTDSGSGDPTVGGSSTDPGTDPEPPVVPDPTVDPTPTDGSVPPDSVPPPDGSTPPSTDTYTPPS
jgi:RNA polymerase sigma factor (sigma-70 family)